MIVVSDTSPICYLLLINEIELLPQLYGKVIIPEVVRQELAHKKSPIIVQDWIRQPPDWLMIETASFELGVGLEDLDPGEREAILLAQELNARLVIIDDLLGRQVAKSQNLKVIGLLGVLDEAARQGLVNFLTVVEHLQQTTFRASNRLIQSLLFRHQGK